MAETVTEIAQRAYDALPRRDFEAFLEYVDPDVEVTSLIAEAEGQTFRGCAGIRKWWDEVVASLGGIDLMPEWFSEVDDGLVIRLRAGGTAGGVAVAQTIYQAIVLRDDRAIWCAGFRTEEEAVRAVEARSGSRRARS